LTKGKPWPVEDKDELRKMVQAGKSVYEIAGFFGKSSQSVKKKIDRLDLKVVVHKIQQPATSGGGELVSVECALGKLNDALNMLELPGLDQSETLRLRSIVSGGKVYIEKFAEFLNYRELEARLIELEGKYGALVKKKSRFLSVELLQLRFQITVKIPISLVATSTER
jgi:hypothetical protein